MAVVIQRLPDPTQVSDTTTKDYLQELIRSLNANIVSLNNNPNNILTSTPNTLAGYNNSGVFSTVIVGSNLTLVDGVLSATTPASGTVTSVAATGGAGITVSGSPITTSGTLGISMTNSAANTLAGYDNTGVFSDVTIGSGLSLSGGSLTATGSGGTVTSVAVATNNGITISGSPITTSGTFTLGLGAITPTTVNGITITTGTGTLTLGSNTLIIDTNLELTGTSGSVINLSNGAKRYIGFSTLNPIIQQQGTYVTVPFSGNIVAWSIGVDTGTATVKVWKVATGTATPTSGNSISSLGVSLSSNTYIRSTTLSDFTTTTVAANDIFAFEITAVSGATRIAFELEITAT